MQIGQIGVFNLIKTTSLVLCGALYDNEFRFTEINTEWYLQCNEIIFTKFEKNFPMEPSK